MKTQKRISIQKAACFALAAMMLASVLCFAAPQDVLAASLSFKGKGTSSVSMKDKNSYGSTKKSSYIKFKPSVTGYVTVKIENNSKKAKFAKAEITFCDKNKTALGKKNEVLTTSKTTYNHYLSTAKKFKKENCYTRTYGVKKGETYYFKVNSPYGIKLTAQVVSMKKGTNSSKSKAQKLAEGKTVKGVIIAGDKTVDWYKISVPKKSKVKLSYTTKTNGSVPADNNGIKISFCKSNGNLFISGKNASTDYVTTLNSSRWTEFFKKDSKGNTLDLTSGTYYIKVERYNKASSGQYTLSWKTF